MNKHEEYLKNKEIKKKILREELRELKEETEYSSKKQSSSLVGWTLREIGQRVEMIELQLDGINLQTPHLQRSGLLAKLCGMYESSSFVLLSSPSGSGKTSLLNLFAARMDIGCIYISCLDEEETLSDLLKPHGIDLKNETVTDDRPRVIMLDSAQKTYGEKEDWTILIKNLSRSIPQTKFIIAASHSLEGDHDTPVEFDSFPTLGRRDFLLIDKDATQLLTSNNGLGLPNHLQFASLVSCITSECNGLIATLRLAITTIEIAYIEKNPTESELLQFYLSRRMTQVMARCFGSAHKKVPDHLKCHLISCLNGPCDMPNEKDEYLILLQKCGILVTNGTKFDYSSPLARRYFFRWLFPIRYINNPSTIKELIIKAIEHMSASFLKQCTPSNDFPKEAVFQQLLLQGFAKNTKPDCVICPELSKRFPPFETDPNREIDFYLNGSLRWGIQLHIKGRGVGEHLERFTPHDKYAPLDVSDYAVVDFRVNETGECTNVQRHAKRISVFFKKGDFSSCKCIFGEDHDDVELKLSN
ncbi:hypothetical protein ROZALSC1DRAFT_23665 [Rozella allomycis CSF55]|uniref:AAA+ ATPase domain-containing protein n=1 Tax=Rozella allomycis (strain CSF55) TaxID=988480 RepID=A0A4P9YFQ5_ROZAC|nr:hypothetical protein ROZALSC1DRAFT_23665 [Rozella allomycis CSF55]